MWCDNPWDEINNAIALTLCGFPHHIPTLKTSESASDMRSEMEPDLDDRPELNKTKVVEFVIEILNMILSFHNKLLILVNLT